MRLLLALPALLMTAGVAFADVAPDPADLPRPRPNPAAEPMRRYANPRFGYSIAYPVNRLSPQPESENADGRVFSAPRGVEVRVWGGYNALAQSPRDIAAGIQGDCAQPRSAYRLVRPTVVVVSCVTSDRYVLYQRTLIRGNRLVSVRFHYPVSRREFWDAMTPVMAGSLEAH